LIFIGRRSGAATGPPHNQWDPYQRCRYKTFDGLVDDPGPEQLLAPILEPNKPLKNGLFFGRLVGRGQWCFLGGVHRMLSDHQQISGLISERDLQLHSMRCGSRISQRGKPSHRGDASFLPMCIGESLSFP